MTTIRFPGNSDKNIVKDLNAMIADTQEQTSQIEALLDRAPYVLLSYKTMRNILRTAKRIKNLNAAINRHASEGCPPKKSAEEPMEQECSIKSCEKCWQSYIKEYKEGMEKSK